MIPHGGQEIGAWLEHWAGRHGISCRRGEDSWTYGPTATPSIRVLVRNLDPRTDFGRLHYRTPAAVLEPATQDELIACIKAAATAGVALTIRGCGHSTDGQVLADGGIVINTRRLRRLIADSPDTQRVCVEGGMLWADVCRYLRPLRRRPLVVTGNLLTTVGGTLSAGGIGTTSFIHGAQIATVSKLGLILASGETLMVGPDDELFRYVLAGAGQLAIIAQAEFKTETGPQSTLVWHLAWPSLERFCSAALRIRKQGKFDILRGRFYYRTATASSFVDGYAGVFCEQAAASLPPPLAPPVRDSGETEPWRDMWPADAIPDEREAPEAAPTSACPALRFSLPIPDGLREWTLIERDLERADLTRFMRTGSSVSVVRVDKSLPLAPFPDSDDCVFIGLHPEVPRLEAPEAERVLRDIADRVLDAGGKLDITSLRPHGPLLRRQFGASLCRFRELKRRVDPHGALNPGQLGPTFAGFSGWTRSEMSEELVP